MADIHGVCGERFEAVRTAFARNVDSGEELGASLVLDIDETSLTNWPNLIADDFGFVADGPCDALPAGPCGFNQWILKGSARAIEPARKLFEAAKATKHVRLTRGTPPSVRAADQLMALGARVGQLALG